MCLDVIGHLSYPLKNGDLRIKCAKFDCFKLIIQKTNTSCIKIVTKAFTWLANSSI